MLRSVVVFLFLFFGSLFAQESFNMDKLNEEIKDPLAYSAEDSRPAAVSPVFLVFRIIGSLALMSALIFAVVWGIRKSGILEPVAVNPDSPLELLDELTTGTGNSIVLVRFEDRVLMLGQTSSSMTTLETFEGETAKKLIANSAGGKSVGTFRANLNKYVMNLQKGTGRG